MMYLKNYIYLILLTMSLVFGQNTKIDRKAINQMKKMGITIDDAKKILKDQGVDINDSGLELEDRIKQTPSNNNNLKFNQELKAVIEKEKSASVNSNLENVNDFPSELENDDKKSEVNNNNLVSSPTSISPSDQTDYFGYNIFSGNPEIFEKSFQETVDPNYLIGPGDEVVIMLWGETEFQENYIVSRDGYLFIKNVGQIFVNGLTLEKLEKKLFRNLKKVYSSLDSNNGKAATFFDVSLGALVLRPLRIFVLGDVSQPGAYTVKPSTTLFSSLYYFNGPTTKGSLRGIKLIRKEIEIAEIDFYDYLLTGKQLNDIRLQRDDVIFIPPIGKSVTVKGEIKRPAVYELKENEGLSDLIEILGGLPVTTYRKRIQIDRIIPPAERADKGMDRTIIDVELNEILINNINYKLQDGDVIKFLKISDNISNTVSINGPVSRPGTYDLGQGLTLKQLIIKADNLLGDIYMDRVDIVRTSIDGTQSQLDFNLQKVMNGNSEHNIKLVANDIITIYSKSQMLFKTNVSIIGHVLSPGEKPFRKGMQVVDLVFSGGGFQNKDHLNNTFLDRADLYRLEDGGINERKVIIPFNLDSVLAGLGIAQMELKMGDQIRIYSINDTEGLIDKTIKISGFVKRPGIYPLYEDLKIKELLFIAGGFDDFKHIKNTILFRADLIRVSEDLRSKKIIPFDLNDILHKANDSINNFSLSPGDEIRIYSKDIFNSIPMVTIGGIVAEPGDYELKINMNLRDLILESGGVNIKYDKYRVDIARINKNYNADQFAKIKTVELSNTIKSLDLNSKNDGAGGGYQLKENDVVIVRPFPFQFEAKTVNIDGYVYYPGEYVISHPNEMVTDIIERAGGMLSNAYPMSSALIRNGERIQVSFEKIMKNPKSRFNFEILDGDSIYIGSKPNLVIINGEVNNPGNYQFTRGNRMNDYLKLAGGLTDFAAKGSIFIIYPDGKTKKLNRYLPSPYVYDGSTIVAVRKEDVEPFSITDYVTGLTEFWADLTQAYLMIILALRNS